MLEVRVVRHNEWDDLETLLVVSADEWVGVAQGLLGVLDHDLTGEILGLGNTSLLVLVVGTDALVYGLSVTTEVALVVVVELYVVASHVVVHGVADVATLVVETILVGEPATHLSLDKEEDLLDELNGVWASEDGWVEGSSGLSLKVHEISLILGISLLLFADLGKFVVSDVEELSVNSLGLMKSSAG